MGKFYIAIDRNLQARGFRPDNAYRFISRSVTSNYHASELMKYGSENEVKALRTEVKECSQHIKNLTVNFNTINEEVNETKNELGLTRQALTDITNDMRKVEEKRNNAQKKVTKLQKVSESALTDCVTLEDNLYTLEEENSELSQALNFVQKQKELPDGFTFETKSNGKLYSPAVRTLYYTLLADQIPPAKIENIIKAVLKCFSPTLDIAQLELPKERCAGYMRSEEMKTLSMAHKAIVICEKAQDGVLHLNTDGTTLEQKKLNSVAINNVVVSINEVPDGTAATVISDVSGELQKLRETAHALSIPNADSINWTLLASSTSDSAATQKCFNKLIEQCVDEDREKLGEASHETIELVENFCAMHLGVNLRKAFLEGIKVTLDQDDDHNCREYHPVDTFVHEFCKLLGRHGAPEYGCGALAFPDFLHLMSTDTSVNCKEYYVSCAAIRFNRQIGSRYFVTAANAMKIIFVREAAIHFLKYTGKQNGNRLEKEVYRKLLDLDEMVLVRADALMFFHIYADLVMLAKSNKLEKTALDMNQHYLELQMFLQELECHPEVIMDRNYSVFRSEARLYGEDKKLAVNHRINPKSKLMHDSLFILDKCDEKKLYSLISAGAAAMRKKLCSYAHNQLPGGTYWDPEPSVKSILKELKPSNDFCESILGLNDYLSTAIPNMHQMARSNLVELKKNKSMKWLQQLPNEQQQKVLDLAVEKRSEVLKDRKEENQKRSKERQDHLLQAHIKRKALEQRAQKERDMLSQEHLITSSRELRGAISDIDKEIITISKKKAKKLKLLRAQINIRRKLLKQKIQITFSHSRRQRPICEIINELTDFIDANSIPPEYSVILSDPYLLVGRSISHKFEMEETREEKWFSGIIEEYNAATKLHKIIYDDEDEPCYFALTQDLIMENLKIL